METHYHTRCSQQFFGSPQVPALRLDTPGMQQIALETVKQRVALTGVQPKLSAQLSPNKDRFTFVGLWGDFILKPQSPVYPQMPECEDLTMHLAQLMGISTCAHALIPTEAGEWTYLAKRFDRTPQGLLHVEDMCQLSNLLTERKYKSSHEKIGKLILLYCQNKGLDALAYFERVLFCFLTGNNDMHLKNFSLLHTPEGVRLAPAYDMLNVRILYPQDTEQLALTLNGKKSRITHEDFAHLAERLHIPTKSVANIFERYAAQTPQVYDLIARSFLADSLKAAYQETWSQHWQQLSA